MEIRSAIALPQEFQVKFEPHALHEQSSDTMMGTKSEINLEDNMMAPDEVKKLFFMLMGARGVHVSTDAHALGAKVNKLA
jgi:hypothetical protein